MFELFVAFCITSSVATTCFQASTDGGVPRAECEAAGPIIAAEVVGEIAAAGLTGVATWECRPKGAPA